MFKTVIKEIQQKSLCHLTFVCARPGDGRRTFTFELANDLAMQGFTVCYCSITRTEEYLKSKLLTTVHILSALPQNATYALTKLTESSKSGGVVVLVDNLSSFVLQKGLKYAPVGAYDKSKVKANLLLKLKQLAIQRGMHIVVADTLAHASDTDYRLPISNEAIEPCDNVYILYKNGIDEMSNCQDWYKLKLKKFK